jgi:TP901 family phage tail tape measure protein
MASRADIEAGRAFVRLYLRNELTSQLAGALKAASARLSAFGDSVKQLGVSMAAIGASVSLPIAMIGKRFADFDDQMRIVAGVTGAAGADFQMLTNEAKRLGATTSYTASEIAGLMVELGRAGFNPQEIMASTEAIQNLGRATATPLAEAAAIAGAALRQFNMPTSEATRVADVLATTANSSAQTVKDLGDALAYVGPVATDAGLSIEDTGKALGVLANLGLKGSMGGTGFRRAILAFADPAAQKKLKALGVDAVDANKKLRPIADVMIDLGKATAKMPNSERLAFFQDVFDLRGMTAGMKLSASVAEMEKMSAAIDNAGGKAKSTAAMMDSGLGGSIRIMMSAVEGLALEIGDTLAPTLRMLAKTVENAAGSAMAWVKEHKGIVITAAAVAAGLVAAGAGLIALGVSAKLAAVALGTVAAVVATVGSIASGIGNTIAMPFRVFGAVARSAVTAVGRTVGVLWTSIKTGAIRGAAAFRSVRGAVFGLGAAMKSAAVSAAGLLGKLAAVGTAGIGGLGRGLGRLGGAAGGLVGAAGMLGAMGIGGAFAPMLAMAPLVLGVLGSIGAAVAAVASPVGLLAAGVVAGAVAWTKFSESGRAAWQGLVTAVLPIVETFKGTFNAVKDAITAGDWGMAGKLAIAGLKLAVFQGLGEIEKAFPNVFATILRTVGKIGDGLVKAWGKVTGFLTDQWNNWGKATLDTILEVAGLIPEIWQQAVENMANWMLEQSAKGGLSGAIMSKILGVDMADEQARAEAVEEARREVHKRNLEHAIAQGKQEGLDTTQLEADLAALGGPQPKVDVLADARQAVKAYTETLRSDLEAATDEAGSGRVSETLESFLSKIESGLSAAEAEAEFERLKTQQQTDQYAADFEAAMGGGGGGDPAFAGATDEFKQRQQPTGAPLDISTAVALGPTYSAAAAQAAGQMGSGASPQEKIATSIYDMTKTLHELGLLSRKQDVSNQQVVTMYERFLAAFTYG